MLAILGALGLGLVIGFRHAFEPDHLAAVSTLVGEARSRRGAALLGMWWGVGHTLSLAIVGAVLIALDAAMPARVGNAIELGVGCMLIVLGVRGLVRAARSGGHGAVRWHEHGAHGHVHATAAPHVHLLGTALAWRPLLVGLVHGLAGSGALCALAMAKLPSAAAQVVYIVVFGAGSVAGMAAVTALAGAALGSVAERVRGTLSVAAAVLSIVVGVAWAAGAIA